MRISVYVFVIGLVITSFVMTKILDEIIIVKLDLNRISSLDGRSDYVHTENGKLINNYRDHVVFPNDKLTYKTTLKYNLNENVKIIPTITIIHAGKNATNPIELTSIDFHNKGDSSEISQEFFIGNQGHNEIIIEYQILNSSNNVQLDLARITEQIEVLSLNDKLQSDQNETLFLGTIASVLIGAGTTIALIFSVHYSKKEVDKFSEQNVFSKQQIELLKTQNDDFKKQFSFQNRPWIIINDPIPHLAVYNTREIPWDEYLKNLARDPKTESPKEVKVIISCTNTGKSPAKVIQYRYKGTGKTTLEQLKQNKNSERILFPNQESTYVVTIPRKSNESFFIATLMEYSYDLFEHKGIDSIGRQWEYANNSIWNIDEWTKEQN